MTDGQLEATTSLAVLSPSEKRRLSAAIRIVKNWILERSDNDDPASTLSPPLSEPAEVESKRSRPPS